MSASRRPRHASAQILLLGATGLVGDCCLRLLTARSEVARVWVPVRRDGFVGGEKVTTLPFDFDDDAAYAALPQVDAVFCCLGQPLDRLDQRDALYRVDYLYPMQVARRYQGTLETFSIVTSVGISRWSPLYYCRVKALLERELQTLDLPALHLFQPSLLLGDRHTPHPWQHWFQGRFGPRRGWFRGPLARFRPVAAETLARAMIGLWLQGEPGVARLYAPRMETLARELG